MSADGGDSRPSWFRRFLDEDLTAQRLVVRLATLVGAIAILVAAGTGVWRLLDDDAPSASAGDAQVGAGGAAAPGSLHIDHDTEPPAVSGTFDAAVDDVDALVALLVDRDGQRVLFDELQIAATFDNSSGFSVWYRCDGREPGSDNCRSARFQTPGDQHAPDENGDAVVYDGEYAVTVEGRYLFDLKLVLRDVSQP